MGLLSEGAPLSWQETAKLAEHVRCHGLRQFVALYNRLKERRGDVLMWGDEVEYMVLKVDDANKKVRVALRAKELLAELQKPENEGRKKLASLWRPEYASYMVEGTPGQYYPTTGLQAGGRSKYTDIASAAGVPYGGEIDHFNEVEKNMLHRRQEVEKLLQEDEILVSMAIFPRLGCNSFTWPEASPDPQNSFTRSLFWPSEATYQGHPRFKTLTNNIRERRGEKVMLDIPFMTSSTSSGYICVLA